MSSIQFELASAMDADSAFHRGFKVGVIHFGNLVTVNFGELIPQGILDSVTIYYHGSPPVNSGFPAFSIGKHNGVPMLWTLSEPYGASDWWPSKNDLSDKIDSIDVYVAAPNGYVVASNGLFQGEEPYGPNLTATHWKHRYPIASYLVAIAVTNYAHYTENFAGPGVQYPIENYVFPEDSAFCRSRTSGLLPVYGVFASLFGAYPFEQEKYGQAEFGAGGGMEHQTMTFLGQGAFTMEILSHELAHMWFGDMVTCGSWHDIWLNEGFATYCTGLMYEITSPNLYWPIWKHNEISYITTEPGGAVYCEDTVNIGRIFDSRLSYSKGAMVLHQLRWVIGDSAFFNGTRSYLEDPDLRYGFALTENYKQHMETASGRDLTEYFDNWIYKEGFPSYTLICTQDFPDNFSVTVNQSPSDPSVSFFGLPLPVRLLGENKDTLVILDNTYTGQVFQLQPGFMVDSVDFDPENWLISGNNHVTMGKNELPAGKHLDIQPNPATDRISVIHNLGRFRNVDVVDLSGNKIKADITENTSERLVLNLNRLSPGTYILVLATHDLEVKRKFIVSR